MKFAPKVICLVREPSGFGPALFQALQPQPGSNVTRKVVPFELSVVEKYGASEEPAPGEVAQFFAPDGSPQVSVLLLPNFEPPIAVCAINELLSQLLSEKSAEPPVVVCPFPIAPEKIASEFMPSSRGQLSPLYGIELGVSTESTRAMLAGVPKPPPTLQIHCEPLNCLVHLMQVYKIPAVLLAATGTQIRSLNAADQELEALYELGGFLAKCASLSFTKDEVCLKRIKKPVATKEPWRALYG